MGNLAWVGQGRLEVPGTLTAVGLIGVVLTVRVTIAAPQLEDTVPISTGELIGLTGRSGATVQLITAVLAVLLPITDIIFRNAVPTVACGLVGPTGHGPAWTGEQRIGSKDAW